MSMHEFFYCDAEGRSRGPFQAAQLKKLAATGTITPEMSVRRGESPWRRASTIEGLFPKSEESADQDEEPYQAPAGEFEFPTFNEPVSAPPPRMSFAPAEERQNPSATDNLVLAARTSKCVRFPALVVLSSVYLVFAGVAVVGGLGMGLLNIRLAFGAAALPLSTVLLTSTGWLIAGLLQGTLFLLLSETCRLFLALEKNQRQQADALADIRTVLIYRLQNESQTDVTEVP